MEPFGGAAALGGVITGLMLASWMLGRRQSRLSQSEMAPVPKVTSTPPDEAPASRSFQQPALAERRDTIEGFASVGELHAAVSAYRAAQQVLTTGASTVSITVGWSATGERESCRNMGVGGEPICPSAAVTDPVCDGTGPRLPRPLPAVLQPSAEPAAFTRV